MRCVLAKSAAKTKLDQGITALIEVAPLLVSEDMEGIHRARVASRRLRAVIVAHSSVLGRREGRRLGKAVRGITSGLGVARELDVTIQLLESRRMGLSGAERYACTHTVTRLRELRRNERDGIAAIAALIAGDDFRRVADEALSSVRRLKGCYRSETRAVLKDRRRNLWRAHATWLESESEASLHEVRIAFKKFRYGCEQYADLYGKRMKQLIKSLRLVQDDLGIWNDFRVARGYVESLAEGADPMAASGIAPLAELLDKEAAVRLGAYRAQAVDFFSEDDRNRVRRIIAKIKVPCCPKKGKG
jgi:CHAD domain-containing protein